jgi:hypothetical protein
MSPGVVFAGVYILVVGGLIVLVSALLGPTQVGHMQGGILIGGLALQAVGVALAMLGTWRPGIRLAIPGTLPSVFVLFTTFAFTAMAIASFFATTVSPLAWVGFALVIGIGFFLVQVMART